MCLTRVGRRCTPARNGDYCLKGDKGEGALGLLKQGRNYVTNGLMGGAPRRGSPAAGSPAAGTAAEVGRRGGL